MTLIEEKAQAYMETPMATMKTMLNMGKNLAATLGEAFIVDPETGEMREFVKILQEFLMSEDIVNFMSDLGAVLGEIATSLMPIIINVFETFASLLLDLLGIINRLISSEGFQALMDILIEFGGQIGQTVINMLIRLEPTLIKIFDALVKLAPLLDLVVYAFVLAMPAIEAVVNIIGALLIALEFLMPAINAIAKVIMDVLAVAFGIILTAINLVIGGIGALIGALGDLSGNTGMQKMGQDMVNFTRDAQDAIQSMTDFQDLAMGDVIGAATTDLGAASGRGNVLRGSGDTVIFNTTIEGNVDSEETISEVEEQLNDRRAFIRG
jgi:hypothetical protein